MKIILENKDFLGGAEEVHYRRKGIIELDFTNYFYLLIKGRVLLEFNPDNLAILNENIVLLGYYSMIFDKKKSVKVHVFNPITFLRIPKNNINRIEDESFFKELYRTTLDYLSHQVVPRYSKKITPKYVHVALFIYNLGNECLGGVSKPLLARYANISRVTLNEALEQLIDMGIIEVKKARVEIVSINKLEEVLVEYYPQSIGHRRYECD